MRFAPSFANGRRLLSREPQQEHAQRSALIPAPVLLATDGTASADGAVALAAQLVERRRAQLHVLTVVAPALAPVVAGSIGLAEREPLTDEARREAQRGAVRRQLARFAPLREGFDVEAICGAPARVITATAEQRDPALVVLGLREHSLLDRVFRDETALAVMRHAAVPVLGVTPLVSELPKRAVVGVDFSLSSLHAARAALPLIADDATLYLVHVEPRPRAWDGGTGEDPLLTAALPAGFARFRALLGAPPRVRVEQVVLEGDNFDELDDFARRVGAQLVALGSIRRDAPLPRGGRLREAFVRASGVSVLVGPPVARAGIMED